MPGSLLKFLDRHDLGFHLARAISWGLALRLILSFFSYGPVDLKEYESFFLPVFLGVENIKASAFEAALMPLFQSWHSFAKMIGADSGLSQVRLSYALASLFSLLAILPCLVLGRAVENSRVIKLYAHACAFHILLAFCLSKMMVENLVAVILLWSFAFFYLAAKTNKLYALILGYVLLLPLLALSPIVLAFAPWVLIGCLLRRWWWGVGVSIFFSALLFGLLLYFQPQAFALTGSLQVEPSPLWSWVVLLLFVPFLFLGWGRTKVLKGQGLALIGILSYLLWAAMIGPMTITIIIPIMPIMIWSLCDLWVSQSRTPFMQWMLSPYIIFGQFLAYGLFLASPLYADRIEPLAKPLHNVSSIVYLNVEGALPEGALQNFYLRNSVEVRPVDKEDLTSVAVEDLLQSESRWQGLVVVSNQEDHQLYIEGLSQMSLSTMKCGSLQKAVSYQDLEGFVTWLKLGAPPPAMWYLECEKQKEVI